MGEIYRYVMICIQHDRPSSQSSLQIQDVNYEKNKPRIYNGEENKERVSIFFFLLWSSVFL